jgi:Holliday junction resolvasome RuvABC DNA-binding subunit
VLALIALGFKQIEAHDTVRKAQAILGPQATTEDLVRACLKKGA